MNQYCNRNINIGRIKVNLFLNSKWKMYKSAVKFIATLMKTDTKNYAPTHPYPLTHTHARTDIYPCVLNALTVLCFD